MILNDSGDMNDLLDRCVAGEVTSAETEAVVRWVEADPAPPARRERLERLRRVWAASRRPVEGTEVWDVDAAWRRVAVHAPQAKTLTLMPRTSKWRSGAWRYTARWAAAVALVVGSAAALWRVSTRAPSPEVVAAPGREYTTGRGERMVLTLDDGTRVILGPASHLTVMPGYGAQARLVVLAGEGYFDVMHDAARPFMVRARDEIVRDIGTKFVVRAYGPNQPVVVAVTEGAVVLAGALLYQGDLGRLEPDGAVRIRRGVDLRSYTSWTEGRLVFDDMLLSEAIPVLERWYDVDIIVGDSASYDRRLFATLGSEPIARVLDLVALSLGLRFEQTGRTVTFFK